MDKKCAPGKNFKEGSCIDKKTLKNIAENFTNEYGIEFNTSNKEDLVKDLDKEFKEKFKCKDQLCWLKQKIVKKIDNPDLFKFTFRPKGPEGKLDWLSTTNINDVVEQYEKKHDDFIFLGAVPYDFQELRALQMGRELNFDELRGGSLNEDYNKGKKVNKFGMVINLDPHYKGGSHWVSLYANFEKNQIYFFDSFGVKPKKKIKKFINRISKYMYKKKYHKKLNINQLLKDIKNDKENEQIKNISSFDIRYNNIQHQEKNSECGVYSINFIIRLASGEDFDSITKNITNDDKMNDCRDTYFINYD